MPTGPDDHDPSHDPRAHNHDQGHEPGREVSATQDAWPDVMLASEVADYLRVSYATVIKMTKAGDIPALAIGREFRYLRAEIDKLLRRPARTSRSNRQTEDEPGDAPGTATG